MLPAPIIGDMSAQCRREHPGLLYTFLVAVPLLAIACGDGATSPSDHDDPFVMISKTGTGALKMVSQIQLGSDAPIWVQLDTGSNGLRIDSSVLPQGIQASGPMTSDEFGGNRVLKGRAAVVPVTVGTASGQIVVQVVETITCGGSGSCRESNGIAGFADLAGISGIMGIGLASPDVKNGVFNPLIQLGAPLSSGFVFAVKNPGGGSLTLGPAPAPPGAVVVDIPSSDTPFPDGQPGWNDHALPLCWLVGTVSGCGPTVIDTGGPSPSISGAFFPGSALAEGTVPSETAVTLTTSAGDPLWSFVTAAAPEQVTIEPSSERTTANAGIGVFLAASMVGYDVAAGQLWVLPPST